MTFGLACAINVDTSPAQNKGEKVYRERTGVIFHAGTPSTHETADVASRLAGREAFSTVASTGLRQIPQRAVGQNTRSGGDLSFSKVSGVVTPRSTSSLNSPAASVVGAFWGGA